jgi:hypothetical protein
MAKHAALIAAILTMANYHMSLHVNSTLNTMPGPD